MAEKFNDYVIADLALADWGRKKLEILSAVPLPTRPHGLLPEPDGSLLVELLGRRSAVIGSQAILGSATPATAERWRRSDALVIAPPAPAVEAWLQSHNANAVILRPDRYIVGVARTGSDLDRISQYLPVAP